MPRIECRIATKARVIFLLLVLSDISPLVVQMSALDTRCAPQAPRIIKLGVSTYDNVEATYEKYTRFFAGLTMKYCDKQVGFQVAVGNYSDVLEWWHNKQIDVGIFSAAPTGRLLALEQEEVKEAYVGSLDDTAFWSPDSFASTPRPIYRSMAVVANKPENRDVVSIEDASKKGMHLRFLFVRPDSASGNLIPRYFLGKSRIPVTDWSFTYSGDNSLNDLLSNNHSGEPNTVTVAFLYANLKRAKETAFRILPEPNLSSLEMPVNSVLINYNLDKASFDELRELFIRARGRQPIVKGPLIYFLDQNWEAKFANLQQAFSSTNFTESRASINEIIRDLADASTCTKNGSSWICKAPRLALVLSGGGAKCAYQVGAIVAIEQALQNERAGCGKDEQRCAALQATDINLVAGTSGGSINALLVALGVPRDSAGQNRMLTTWRSLDQNTLFKPPTAIHVCQGILVACVLALLSVIGGGYKSITFKPRMVILFGAASTLCWTIATLWQNYPLSLANHWLEHIALVCASGLKDGGSAGAIGLVLGVPVWMIYRMHTQRTPTRKHLVTILKYSCLISLVMLVVITLEWVGYLTTSDTVSQALTDAVAREIHATGCDKDHGQALLDCLSHKIIQNHLLERDLVITASRLPDSDESQPTTSSDVYFYARGAHRSGIGPDQADKRFVSFEDVPNQSRILEAVLSSSTIYPVFPPQPVSYQGRVDASPRRAYLIDGGFIHNSPIEAAIKWNADRILLIEASPPDLPVIPETFKDNIENAVSFLFTQAQRVDTSSKGQVDIFELRPRCKTTNVYDECPLREDQWSMDLFDFTSTRLKEAEEKGILDVLGEPNSAEAVPHFVRLGGAPQFRDVAGSLR